MIEPFLRALGHYQRAKQRLQQLEIKFEQAVEHFHPIFVRLTPHERELLKERLIETGFSPERVDSIFRKLS